MTVALIYTGHLRTWEQVRDNHKENIFTDETSLFFYTYERPDTVHMKGIKSFSFVQVPESFYPDPFKEHKYNERKRPENTVYQSFGQWHNNFVGFCIVPRGFDVYCRIRPDIRFNGRVDFAKYDLSGDTIYIPDGNDYGGVNDQFAFGNYEVMKKYYSVYLNCHELWADGVEFHSEGMQLANLNKQGVRIVRIQPTEDIIR